MRIPQSVEKSHTDLFTFQPSFFFLKLLLNVHRAVSYLDEMYVATNDGIEPDGAVVAHLYVAHYHSTLAEVAMFAESGSRHPLECLYDSHIVLLNIDH